MKRNSAFEIEQLESRTLLSAAFALPALAPTIAPPTITTVVPNANSGVTLQLTAGVPFSGKVAFYASPVVDPPGAISASINWGDGTTSSAATIQYGTHDKTGGYNLIGSHTYAKAGNYAIKTTVMFGPLPGSGAEFPTRIVATIASKAIVAARPANSAGGVTLHETAGKSFTAVVGTFNAIAPAIGLHATIQWGDGTTSAGVIKSTGIEGIDVIKFSVTGTHTYALAGTYPIHIVVTKLSPVASTAIIPAPIATINSTAIVQSKTSLKGKISGIYTMPFTNPDAGKTYKFTGTGNAGDLGDVTASGAVHLPGFIASGHATGTLTLSNTKGSVTLTLTGPAEPGFGAFPKTLSYVITSGTGAYANATGDGTITVDLGSKLATAVPIFTFTIS